MAKVNVRIKVNGEVKEAEIEPRTLLVHFLREVVGLTGTRTGCDTSNCGACTVLLDGKAVKSCTVLALQANGHEVTTVEGLGKPERLHPIQRAFIEKHAFQCGYCTSGMIMTAFWILRKNKDPDEKEIRRLLQGNLCRCTGYDNIVDAIKYAGKLMREEEQTEEEEVTVRS
ncbi:(2Fe-2S)-binding protein [Thermogymnomonas acidicola]|uniref:(2Fe-2S)-binding protein n=1 Tax=Thermogymnomonas acidicola TaxID=399579 RepID=A0AA37F938_9ARCH|nr:(2Fe-2S)-binding protein [Thermogymnomonas acidicola]GGM70751.1 (2Fe-2S)-binding protein [Thermogymnomonas acidicola]